MRITAQASDWLCQMITADLVKIAQTAGQAIRTGECNRNGRKVPLTVDMAQRFERVGGRAVVELERRGVLAPLSWDERHSGGDHS